MIHFRLLFLALTLIVVSCQRDKHTFAVITTGFGGSGGFGKIISGATEGSNVDLATELTDMIASQRSYTANSKVFQTGSDLLDVLVNLKR